jgi:hypothetical protein
MPVLLALRAAGFGLFSSSVILEQRPASGWSLWQNSLEPAGAKALIDFAATLARDPDPGVPRYPARALTQGARRSSCDPRSLRGGGRGTGGTRQSDGDH